MKLLRYGAPGAERPALIDKDGNVRDLSAIVTDINASTLPNVLATLQEIDERHLPVLADIPRIGPCVGNVGKFVCVGRNYAEHAKETGQEPPSEPILFLKATSAITGPNDPIELPRHSTKLDWEAELGVVIGTRAKYVDESDALRHVAGYCTLNDVSERAFQNERGGQFTKGKSHDTFGPIGPWLVTADEIADPQNLSLWLEVDGVRMQESSTRHMMFSVAYLVSYISQFMTLETGDIIATGTPSGVGLGRKPPVFLQAGQVVRLEVEGLGVQEHVVQPASA